MKKAHNEEIHIDGGEQGHKCEFCEKAFFRKESVRRHIREAHEGKLVKEEGVIYECGQCEKKYERRDVLRRHVRLVHEAVQVKEALLTRLTRYVNFMNFEFFLLSMETGDSSKCDPETLCFQAYHELPSLSPVSMIQKKSF